MLGLAFAGAFLGTRALPAGAAPRTLVVTLVTGQTITVTVDVPPGTPLDQIRIPGVSTPIASIAEAPSPQGAPTPVQVQVTPPQPAPAAAPAPPLPEQAQRTPPSRTATPRKPARSRRHARPHVTRSAGVESVVAGATARPRPHRAAAGAPTPADPTFSLALPGPAPLGVPNFFIEKFRIPPFLLPIYQAAGTEYGVRWEVLAAINEIETDYGRNVNVSTAGAVGWMQFMPSTWKRWAVDANRDHVKDPYNPVDAIFSAARYLKAAGAAHDLRGAVFAYNHAGWYVDSVILRARLIGGLPADFVGSLTGLTEGRFPVDGRATYAESDHPSVDLFARAGAPVVAVQDGRIVGLGAHTVRLRDVYGNTYTYGHLAGVAKAYPGPKVVKERLFANAPNPAPRKPARTRRLRRGALVVGGTVVGRVRTHVTFAIRPAGAPRIDPKPILDGWKLLESTAIYRVAGKNPLIGADPTIGQVLLMSKVALQRRVLEDARVDIYACGRRDIREGHIDRRVLATIEFLAASGLKPTITSLHCGHSYLAKSGNVSEHSTGDAVDIAAINGIPILGHQGPGSIADITIRRLLTLQGTMKPHQIISLMTYPNADNTLALPDHNDHIHVGFHTLTGDDSVLKPDQWNKLIDRLKTIDNPEVRRCAPAAPLPSAAGGACAATRTLRPAP
jgi:hypothetical protein